MAAISNRQPAIDVIYTRFGQEVRRHFTDAHTAKRFYATKLKSGSNPRLVDPKNSGPVLKIFSPNALKENTMSVAAKKNPVTKTTSTVEGTWDSPKNSKTTKKKVAAKKTPTKKKVTAKKVPVKKTPVKKVPTKKVATKKISAKKREGELSVKGQGVLDYLLKHDATKSTTGIEREKVWKDCGVTWSVIVTLKKLGFLVRDDREDGKFYRLTPEGKKASNK